MSMKLSLGGLLVLVSVLLTGCGEQERSAAWYIDHPKEMNEKLEECSDNERLQQTANCRNVLQALLVGK